MDLNANEYEIHYFHKKKVEARESLCRLLHSFVINGLGSGLCSFRLCLSLGFIRTHNHLNEANELGVNGDKLCPSFRTCYIVPKRTQSSWQNEYLRDLLHHRWVW